MSNNNDNNNTRSKDAPRSASASTDGFLLSPGRLEVVPSSDLPTDVLLLSNSSSTTTVNSIADPPSNKQSSRHQNDHIFSRDPRGIKLENDGVHDDKDDDDDVERQLSRHQDSIGSLESADQTNTKLQNQDVCCLDDTDDVTSDGDDSDGAATMTSKSETIEKKIHRPRHNNRRRSSVWSLWLVILLGIGVGIGFGLGFGLHSSNGSPEEPSTISTSTSSSSTSSANGNEGLPPNVSLEDPLGDLVETVDYGEDVDVEDVEDSATTETNKQDMIPSNTTESDDLMAVGNAIEETAVDKNNGTINGGASTEINEQDFVQGTATGSDKVTQEDTQGQEDIHNVGTDNVDGEDNTTISNVVTNSPPLLPEETTWPHLVGMTGEDAQSMLEIVYGVDTFHIEIHFKGTPLTRDYRRDRIRIIVDDAGVIVEVPRVG